VAVSVDVTGLHDVIVSPAQPRGNGNGNAAARAQVSPHLPGMVSSPASVGSDASPSTARSAAASSARSRGPHQHLHARGGPSTSVPTARPLSPVESVSTGRWDSADSSLPSDVLFVDDNDDNDADDHEYGTGSVNNSSRQSTSISTTAASLADLHLSGLMGDDLNSSRASHGAENSESAGLRRRRTAGGDGSSGGAGSSARRQQASAIGNTNAGRRPSAASELTTTSSSSAGQGNLTYTASGRRVYQGRSADRIARIRAAKASRDAARKTADAAATATTGAAETTAAVTTVAAPISTSSVVAETAPSIPLSPSRAAASTVATHTATRGTGHDSVQAWLVSLGLLEYYPRFAAEELTSMQLLRAAVAGDASRARELLKEVGVSKVGHRERMLVSLFNSSNGNG
jgi:hypothetical protein